MQWGLLLSDRKWCDYVVYNPDFNLKKIQIQRVERDEKVLNTMKSNYFTYENEIDQRINELKK